VTGSPNPPHKGQEVTIVFNLKNVGPDWGSIRVEPNVAGYSLDPGWLQLWPDDSGIQTLTVNSWPGGTLQIKAEHWDYDVTVWVVDNLWYWPPSALPTCRPSEDY
jgi:predicted Zn-dependent protease